MRGELSLALLARVHSIPRMGSQMHFEFEELREGFPALGAGVLFLRMLLGHVRPEVTRNSVHIYQWFSADLNEIHHDGIELSTKQQEIGALT